MSTVYHQISLLSQNNSQCAALTFIYYNSKFRMFSPAVIDHFKNPRNPGDILDATATAEVTNPVCGDILRLSVKTEAGRIVEARFKAQGCVTAIACSSYLTELLTGKTLDEARRINYQEVSEGLGGLPPTTVHGSQLAAEALRAVLAKLK
jgi:nitrogen fixation protein NifU and related proteins